MEPLFSWGRRFIRDTQNTKLTWITDNRTGRDWLGVVGGYVSTETGRMTYASVDENHAINVRIVANDTGGGTSGQPANDVAVVSMPALPWTGSPKVTVTGPLSITELPPITGEVSLAGEASVKATIEGTAAVAITTMPEVPWAGSPTVTVSALPDIHGSVTLNNEPTVHVASLPAVPWSGTPKVIVDSLPPMSGTVELSGTPAVKVANTVTVTGDVALSGTPHVSAVITSLPVTPWSGAPKVTVDNTIAISGTVELAGTPTVAAAITNMPAVPWSGSPSVKATIDGTPTVHVGSLPNVIIASMPNVSGTVAIAGTPTVTIANAAVSVSGNVGITGTPSVKATIEGTPTVSISGTVATTTTLSRGAAANTPLYVAEATPTTQVTDTIFANQSVSQGVNVTGKRVIAIVVPTILAADLVVQASFDNGTTWSDFYLGLNKLTLGSASQKSFFFDPAPFGMTHIRFRSVGLNLLAILQPSTVTISVVTAA